MVADNGMLHSGCTVVRYVVIWLIAERELGQK